MQALATQPEIVQCGNRRFPFTSYEEISRAYCEARDATGATSSNETGTAAPDCVLLKKLYDEEYCIGYVSYNGKVWLFDDLGNISFDAPKTLVFNPYAQELLA